jgi:lysine-ketoglutarate reductase/saccharopine dehydrogenase-like protein (TIGR00300 family)
MHSQVIELHGHLIDSWILPRVFDTIMDLEGDFEVLHIAVGRHKHEPSYVRLRVAAPTEAALEHILEQLQEHGATGTSTDDVQTEPAPRDGALPLDFYSTTNLPTDIRLNGRWVPVRPVEMDVAIVVDREAGTAASRPMLRVRAGEEVVVGHAGVRVHPMERARGSELFSFMQSAVSSEKPKNVVIHEIAQEMRAIRAREGKIVFVAGPAIIHSGAGPYLGALIREGYVNVLLGGNAIAVHDVEAALFETSLGLNLASAIPVEGGHRHHMRAINAIRRAGSLREAVASGELTRGVMYEAVKKGIPMVLAGSIRDDGPLPDVITDVIAAQEAMRETVAGAELVLMISTMLHGIATGNLLPATVRTVVVDINPAVVTKLADRGSWQAVGLVTDAELFLRELTVALGMDVRPLFVPQTTPNAG